MFYVGSGRPLKVEGEALPPKYRQRTLIRVFLFLGAFAWAFTSPATALQQAKKKKSIHSAKRVASGRAAASTKRVSMSTGKSAVAAKSSVRRTSAKGTM